MVGGEKHKKAVSFQRSSVSQERLVSRTGDVNPRHPRRDMGNHKGCPYKLKHGAQCLAASWVLLSPARWRGRGFFRADPSSTGAVCFRMGTQGKDACTWPLGDSRKNRPRAERRRSFWPFFLGVQEKGRKIINVYLYKEGSLRILLSFVFVDEPCNSHIFSERILKSFRFF